jgi:hypothetical protein
MRLLWNQIKLLNMLLLNGRVSVLDLLSWGITQQTINTLEGRRFILLTEGYGSGTSVTIEPYGKRVMNVLDSKVASSIPDNGETEEAYYERMVRTIKVEDLK